MIDARDNVVPGIDPLDGTALLSHASALAYNIGPRPAGHESEARARTYIRKALQEAGITEVKAQPFQTPDTWGYSFGAPLALSLGGLLLGRLGKLGRALGAVIGAAGTYLSWRVMSVLPNPLVLLGKQRPSANLIVRIPAEGRPLHKVVLLAHTDTNRHRASFSPARRGALLASGTSIIGLQAIGTVAQVIGSRWLGRAVGAAQAAMLGALIADEKGPYVDGANDNASAVACLLGIATAVSAQPLQHTDVWLVFTGAEEVGCLGAHALLDEYGDQLRDAYFIDFEMVGRGELAYITRHSTGSYLSSYAPDAESVALAERASAINPRIRASGRDVVMFEEVGALRGRGYKGICLIGLEADGWPANWHQETDAIGNLQPEALERAARFGMAMLQALEDQPR
jgi:hypothetical protein